MGLVCITRPNAVLFVSKQTKWRLVVTVWPLVVGLTVTQSLVAVQLSVGYKMLKRNSRHFDVILRHWLNWKLSFRQRPVQPVTEVSSKCQYSCCSAHRLELAGPLAWLLEWNIYWIRYNCCGVSLQCIVGLHCRWEFPHYFTKTTDSPLHKQSRRPLSCCNTLVTDVLQLKFSNDFLQGAMGSFGIGLRSTRITQTKTDFSLAPHINCSVSLVKNVRPI